MFFNEDAKFHDVKLLGEDDALLGTVRAFSYCPSPTERVTLIDPVLSPVPNTTEATIDGETVNATFKVNILSHRGFFIRHKIKTSPSVTCQRQHRPHALDSHGEFTCDTPVPV